MKKVKISEFMITDVVTITEDKTIRELLELLVKHKIGGVPVVGENNELKAMISDGDVIRYLQPKGRTVYDMFSLILVSEKETLQHKISYAIDQTVRDIIRHKEIQVVRPHDGLDVAVSIFAKYRFKKIPVIDDANIVVGVVSRGDVIRSITNKIITS